MMEELTKISEQESPRTEIKFSEGELKVLQLVGEGYTNISIAQALKCSVRTIETRRANLMRKTGTANTATLIKYAVRNNLIS